MTFIELLDSESDLLWTFAFPCFMGLTWCDSDVRGRGAAVARGRCHYR